MGETNRNLEVGKKDFSKLYQIRDSGIFLGIIYAIGFIVMLPVYLYYTDNILNIMELLFLSLATVVIIHLAFNWMYYLTISLPLLTSITLFILGWAIFIFNPISELFVKIIIEIINKAIFGKSFDLTMSVVDPIFKLVDRISQFLIFIGGVFWWLVKKGESIKYKALGFYLVFFAFLGAVMGIGNMTNVFFFLFIWYLLYIKVKGLRFTEDAGRIAPMFKLGATIVILSGIAGVEVVGTGLNTALLFFEDNQGVYFNFINIYPKILGVLMLFGVWKPTIITNLLPENVKTQFEKLNDKGRYLVKWI